MDSKKLSSKAFERSFLEHVASFMEVHALLDSKKKKILSISGGVDSIVMAHVFHKLGLSFEIVHFNHGTRGQKNLEEARLVKKFAEEINSPFHIINFSMNLNDSNFEAKSRELRKKTHKDFIKKNYQVFTAHHIDDSFEWSLMQSFKQSGVKSSLGIPVMSNGIARPFMCVSKKHILKYARAAKLFWMEDDSNNDESFERNFLRKNLSSLIQERYPSALKHYVSRSNQAAYLYGVHRLVSTSGIQMITEESGGVLCISENFKQHKSQLKECIHKFSTKARGEIDTEVDKLITSLSEIKKDLKANPFKGPMTFSGGVRVYILKDHLFITNDEQHEFYKAFDTEIKNYFQNLSQIPSGVIISPFPNLVVSFEKKLQKPSKFIHPLIPVTCMWLKSAGISYTFTPLMHVRDRQMLANAAVILDSSVMGL